MVSVGFAGALGALGGLFFALPVVGLGLLLSGVAAWARLPAEESVPRLVVLLLAAMVVEYFILAHYFGQ